jgi:hypothetical protein
MLHEYDPKGDEFTEDPVAFDVYVAGREGGVSVLRRDFGF